MRLTVFIQNLHKILSNFSRLIIVIKEFAYIFTFYIVIINKFNTTDPAGTFLFMENTMMNYSKTFVRGATLMLVVATLPGCLPLTTPTLISLAVDGFSYAATGKSVADHAISGLAQQDCSIGRAVLTNTHLCRDEEIPPVLLADNLTLLTEAPTPLAENETLLIEQMETASRSDDGENPLYTSQHPSRWPASPTHSIK